MKANPSTRPDGIHRWRPATWVLAAALALLTTSAARAAPSSRPSVAARREGPAAGYSARALLASGDAALAAGHPGGAIVELERARLLAPRSALVAGHLAHAREVASLPPASPDHATRVARLLSGSEWSQVALGGLALAAAGVILVSWGVTGRKRAAGLVVAGLAATALALFAAKKVTPARGAAVVVAADGTARIAPFSGAEPAFVVQEGAAVTVRRAHGDYVLVSSAEGQGWLPRTSVETILPADAHRP